MTKKIIILLAFVFILGGLIVVLEKPFKDPFQEQLRPFYPQLKAADVTSIDIEYFVYGVRLEKDSEGQWFVTNKKTDLQKKIEEKENTKSAVQEGEKFKADPQKVNQVIETFIDLKKSTPISSNPEKLPMFQITDASLNVTLFDQKGEKLARLFVGKQGPDFMSSYVRDENSNEVYIVEQYLKGIFNQALEDWKLKDESQGDTSTQEAAPKQKNPN